MLNYILLSVSMLSIVLQNGLFNSVSKTKLKTKYDKQLTSSACRAAYMYTTYLQVRNSHIIFLQNKLLKMPQHTLQLMLMLWLLKQSIHKKNMIR